MKNYIGKDLQGSYICQELNDKGIIRGFNCYNLVELYDGTMALSQNSWVHSVEFKGVSYKSGEKPAKIKKLPKVLDGVYKINAISCEACSAYHDSDSYKPDFIILDCSAYCKECIVADQVLVQVNEAGDIFKSKDLQGVEMKDYEKIDTLFCDSSGLIASYERALTKNSALVAVEKLIADNEGIDLYAGLTGIGQFQVYVSIYKKSA
jgi:hypothetical protein